ncbi:maleylpyruvate isomerase family mycothiol-dependent enzyme [Streptosporangiaceae bacterium NEAU-GS5]|nr:maleylpyruvate isomerase family mycothiol-dependent enzyme [Streptosporangiaceae bacterium NEAU-GS5]
MGSADTNISALRTGYDDLAGLVSGLGIDDLERSSGSSEWDISQVLSHLGSGAEIGRAVVEAALDGKPAPGGDFNHSVWDRWNAMTRRERADGFIEANEILVRLYESLDAATRESLRIDMGFLPAPIDVATAARMRLNEFTLHAWDVHVSFDEQATLRPDATAILLHGDTSMLSWIAKPDALDGRRLVIKVTTTDPASVIALRLQEPIGIDFDAPEQADGTLTLPAEAWLRLLAGRLKPPYIPDALILTEGAADLALLRRVFPGF